MAYARLIFDSHESALGQKSRSPKRSFWRRVYDAMIASRQHQADLAIARYLSTHGGKLTDESEREIERRFLQPSYGKY